MASNQEFMPSGLVFSGIDLLAEELESQGANPPGHDKVIGAFCLAVLDQIENDGPFYAVVVDFLDKRPIGEEEGTSPSEAVGILRAAVSTDQQYHDHTYPKGRENKEAWADPLDEIASVYTEHELEPRSEQLVMNLWTRKVQTNIPSRYGPVELLMQGLRPRFEDGIDWLDVGTGIMEGPHQLILKGSYPLDPISVVESSDLPGPTADQENSELTQKANSLLNRESMIRHAIGIDIMYPYDVMNVLWARGSLRPSELNDEQFMEKFSALAYERPSNAEALAGNFSHPKDLNELDEKMPDNKFDMISILTATHQMSKEDVKDTIENAKDRVAPEGIIYLQDFAWKHPRQPNSLRFFRHWHQPWKYRGYVLDMARGGDDLQEVIRSEDSRAKRLQFQSGKLAIEGCLKTLEELIQES